MNMWCYAVDFRTLIEHHWCLNSSIPCPIVCLCAQIKFMVERKCFVCVQRWTHDAKEKKVHVDAKREKGGWKDEYQSRRTHKDWNQDSFQMSPSLDKLQPMNWMSEQVTRRWLITYYKSDIVMNLDLYFTFFPRVSESLIWALSNIPFAIRVLKMASLICTKACVKWHLS